MQVTKVQKQKAAEIAKAQKITTVWVNASGEFFTTDNLASLSVAGEKDKYAKIDLNAKVEVETPDNPEK
jgi:hypothetical protein